MNAAAQPPVGITALIYVVVIAIFVWRMMRPARVSVARIWVRPVILIAVTAVSIWAEQVAAPSPVWEIAAIVIGGAIVGVPIGVVRGRHSEVKGTDRPGVFYVHASPLVIVVWLLAFIARAAVRYALPGAGHTATIWGLGLLAFATSAIAVSGFMIHQKLIVVAQTQAAQRPG